MSLTLCPSCHRHVKSRDACCPFCGTAMRLTSAASAGPSAASPVAGAMLIGLGVALAGCSSSDTPTPTQDATTDSYAGEVTPLYGPPPDTGADTTVLDSTTNDTGDTGAVAAYGPPPDTGSGDTTTDGKTDSPTDSLPAGAYGPPPDTGAG